MKIDIKPELLNSVKGYKPRKLFNDMLAGLMVALVALPLNLAMGTRQTPGENYFAYAIQIGLWAAIVGGILLSMFGGTKYSIGGPTAPFITIIVILLAATGNNMHNVFLATMLAGIILMIAGILRAGRALKFVSYPVVIGICLGIGITLLFNLLSDLGFVLADHTDLTRSIDSISPFISRLMRTGMGLAEFSVSSLLIGGFAVALTYILPKVHKKIPAIIVAIAAATGLSFIFRATNVEWLQPITIYSRHGSPAPAWGAHLIQFPQVSWASPQLYLFAIAIAVVATLEGMMSSTAVENISGVKFNPNAEIFGHGVANFGSGLFGGLPVTAAMARTNLNYENGAKSNLAGIFQSLFLLIFYVALMQFIGPIPLAALIAPLVKVAITTSFFPKVARLIRFNRRCAITILATGLITVIFGVHFGVIAGVGASFLTNIKSIKTGLTITEIPFEQMANYKTFDEHFEAELEKPTIKVLKIEGTVFFANVYKLVNRIKELMQNADEVILDMEKATNIDATVGEQLSKLTKIYAKNGKRLTMHNICPETKKQYEMAFRYLVKGW